MTVMRVGVVTIGLMVLASALVVHADNPAQPVRFAIIGDRTGGHVEGVYGRIVKEIERLKPEFVVTVGDQIEGYHTDSARYEEEWDEYQTLVASFSMPVYYTPGNHDIFNSVAEEAYRRRIGEPNYSFDHRGLHIVILDVSRWEQSSELPTEQLVWLESDLVANQDAMQTLVFYHKPFWYSSIARGNPDTLHSLFVAYGVDAVFTGHFHTYFSGEYDGVKYTSIGSSGGGVEGDTSRMGFHFAWVTVSETGIDVAPVKGGAVLPWDERTADDIAFQPDSIPWAGVRRAALRADRR